MLHPMLVMPCLVFGLALFQLFLYCLVNLLDLFNELGCLVHITVSINYYVFTKDKIQGRPWCETKTGLKRRSLCRRMFCSVVSMLYITQMFNPEFGMLSTIASEQLDHCPVDHFCLAICLWMKGCAFLQFGVHQFSQTRPKLPNKLGVSIKYNGSG